jgi:hypothetical protein
MFMGPGAVPRLAVAELITHHSDASVPSPNVRTWNSQVCPLSIQESKLAQVDGQTLPVDHQSVIPVIRLRIS